jgi:beta-galactosidase
LVVLLIFNEPYRLDCVKYFFNILLFLSVASTLFAGTEVSKERMQQVYEEVKTPCKYGLVLAPDRNDSKMDCPTVFREGKSWYMSYLVYNGKEGRDGRGYETWLAESPDLLHWKTLGRILSFKEKGWDNNQRGGYISLIDHAWGGSYKAQTYAGKHWMSYIGGDTPGYELGMLKIGIASTGKPVNQAHEWTTLDKPVLSPQDPDNSWWESLTQYKSNVIWDKTNKLGAPFVMFYNAGGINPQTKVKGERIGIALSNDMLHWKRYAGSPVINHEGGITGDAVIQKMGDLYVLFYFSAFRPGNLHKSFNNFACSYDLIHWTDWTGEELIVPSEKYDNLFAHKSSVVKYEGVVYHFYCAVDKDNQRGIAVATSKPLGRSSVRFPDPDHTGFRKEISLNGVWESYLVDPAITGKKTEAVDYSVSVSDAAPWQKVNVPHNWDQYYGYRRLKHGNLHGNAWYRKTIQVPDQGEGKRYFLYFEGVGSYATVFVNGRKVGGHKGGRTTFTLDVTKVLKPGRENLIVVEAEHPAYISDLPWVCGGCSNEWGFSEGAQPLGIFRPVTLVVTDEVRVQPFGVHLWNEKGSIRQDGADIQVETTLKNYGESTHTMELISKLLDSDGIQVSRTAQQVQLKSGEECTLHSVSTMTKTPRLWSLEHPELYTMVTMLKENDKVIDEEKTPYGLRTISWPMARNDGDKRFLLNGKPVLINGVCEYEHQSGISQSFSNEMIQSRVEQIRDAGFNAFRDAHQPHNLLYQKYWNETGMLWWPQFSAHIWYDTPDFRENFKTLLREWIIERRNSPSLILWGLQNESSLPADFAKECVELIRQLDPTTSSQRLVTTCNVGEGTDWNVVQNWSGTYGGSPEAYGKELSQQLLNGEYGAWRSIDLHTEGGFVQKGIQSEDRMTLLMEQKIRLAEQYKDSLCGQFLWVFNSHENPGRIQNEEGSREIDRIGPFNYKGLFTPWGEPTDAYYLYRSNYASKDSQPMVYMVSHTWPDRWTTPGVKDSLIVYSNCDSVELFNDVNHLSLGVRTKAGKGTHFQWDDVYMNYNVLYVVGYVGGKPLAKDCIVLHHLPEAPHLEDLYHTALQLEQLSAKPVSTKAEKGYHYLYRVNCGGPDYVDANGQKWLADRAITGSSEQTGRYWGSLSWTNDFKDLHPFLGSQRLTNDPISGTKDWELFQTFRYGTDKLKYEFPVASGDYLVELYFTEPWYGTGGSMDCDNWRKFDVAVNGKTVLEGLDIWREVGHDAALKKSFQVHVSGNNLEISFPKVLSGQAVISAIAVAGIKKQATPAPPAPGLISGFSCQPVNAAKVNFWMNTGDKQYATVNKSFCKLPPVLFGAEWIQPAREGISGKCSFTLKDNAIVYLAVAQNLPLPEGFSDTSLLVENNMGETFRLYQKPVAANHQVEIPLNGVSALAVIPEIMPAQEADPRPDVRLEAENAVLTGTVFSKQVFKEKEGIEITKTGPVAMEWTMTPGLAGVYSLRFRYRNVTDKSIFMRLQILAADGRTLRDDTLTFPPAEEKWRVISTTTDAYINAGSYRVRLTADNAKGLWFDSLDVQ